jgi:chondroitin 4-sulfotransferase 11
LENSSSPVRRPVVRYFRSNPWREHHSVSSSVFIHVPRTAGGSIVEALYNNQERGHTPLYAYAYTRPAQLSELFSFSIVRNPWDRMVSAYHRVLTTAKNPVTLAWAERNIAEFGSFESFVTALDGNQSLRWKVLGYPHFRSQFEYLAVDGKVAVDFVGRFENLEADFKKISDKVRPGAVLRHLHKAPHAPYQRYYSDYTAEVVGRLYFDDVSVFGYSFEES